MRMAEKNDDCDGFGARDLSGIFHPMGGFEIGRIMTPERNTAEWRAALVEAYLSGEPTKDIATRLGVSITYPGHLAKKAGARLRGAGPTWRRREEHDDQWWVKGSIGPTSSPAEMSKRNVKKCHLIVVGTQAYPDHGIWGSPGNPAATSPVFRDLSQQQTDLDQPTTVRSGAST